MLLRSFLLLAPQALILAADAGVRLHFSKWAIPADLFVAGGSWLVLIGPARATPPIAAPAIVATGPEAVS